jgi:hypothetical protein
LDGGGELALSELRGKRVLLVFSDPHCGVQRTGAGVGKVPSPAPATRIGDDPQRRSEGESRQGQGVRTDNSAALQQQWEISRR